MSSAEWSIGTSDNDTYLMIPMNVPANMSSKLEIRKDGYLWYANQNTSVSLARIAINVNMLHFFHCFMFMIVLICNYIFMLHSSNISCFLIIFSIIVNIVQTVGNDVT